jgi:hypothetical protein
MKRTTKHIKETAKPAQPPTYKTPAQELEEFKAKVLAMRYGELIWYQLGAYSFSEWTTLSATGFDGKLLNELRDKSDELWPEFVRLLGLNPDALEAFQERFKQNLRLLRALQGPGRPRNPKLALRDEQIVCMHDLGKDSFGKIARKLRIGREVAEAAYYRMKRNTSGR